VFTSWMRQGRPLHRNRVGMALQAIRAGSWHLSYFFTEAHTTLKTWRDKGTRYLSSNNAAIGMLSAISVLPTCKVHYFQEFAGRQHGIVTGSRTTWK
jgi:hypothetical protein